MTEQPHRDGEYTRQGVLCGGHRVQLFKPYPHHNGRQWHNHFMCLRTGSDLRENG